MSLNIDLGLFKGGGGTDSGSQSKSINVEEDLTVNGDLTIGEPPFQAARAKAWFYEEEEDIALKVETNKENGQAQIEFYNDSTTHHYNIGMSDAGGGTDAFYIYSAEAGSSIIEVNNNWIFLNGAQVVIGNIPTSDPSIEGAIYNDSGTLKVSAG